LVQGGRSTHRFVKEMAIGIGVDLEDESGEVNMEARLEVTEKTTVTLL